MARILGLDYGEAKTGVSMSDPLKIIASDYDVIYKKTDVEKIDILSALVKEYEVELIVVGLPLNMDGSSGFQANIVKQFVSDMQEIIDLPVKYIDERLSTQKAEDAMKLVKFSKEEIRRKSDARAASIILQEYLDFS